MDMNTKELAHKWFEAVWNQKQSDTIFEMMDPSAEGVTEGGAIKGPEGFKTCLFDPLVTAFPDLKIELNGCIAEGDEVAVKWTVIATHSGPLMDLAPSGRKVKFSGISWIQFKEGKIIAGSDSYNMHGLIGYLSEGKPCTSVMEA